MTTTPESLLLENPQASNQNLEGQSNLENLKPNRKQWSQKEDMQLEAAIHRIGTKWLQIAAFIPNRNPSQCAQRWKRIKPQSEKKVSFWNAQEDAQLLKLIEIYPKKWGKIAQHMINRTSKQVRERFLNKLNPEINCSPFTQEEDQIIYEAYKKFGSSWTQIAKLLKRRPENMVKNRFYSHIRKQYMHEENPYYIVPEKLNQNKEHQLYCHATKLTKVDINIEVKQEEEEQEEKEEQMGQVKEEKEDQQPADSPHSPHSDQQSFIQPTQPQNYEQLPYFYGPPVYFTYQFPTICYFPFPLELKNENYKQLTISQQTMPDI